MHGPHLGSGLRLGSQRRHPLVEQLAHAGGGSSGLLRLLHMNLGLRCVCPSLLRLQVMNF